MNKIHKPNFLLITISNLLFLTVLIFICAFLTYKFDLVYCKLMSYTSLLLVGIYNGRQCANACSNKIFLYSLIGSTILFVLYLIACFAYKGSNSHYIAYLLCAFNIYLGTFIGCILPTNVKKRKGR